MRAFGEDEGLSDELRFPIFVGSFTEDAVQALKDVRGRAPRPVLDYIQDFDAALEPEVAGSDAYDFRVVLIPQQGPKTEADVAMSFVRLDELEPEQRDQVELALTIIREKQVPVANLGQLLPNQVVDRVREAIGLQFSSHDHTRCWQHYEVRPAGDSATPERTKSDFCRWDAVFQRHTYTEAWIHYLTRKLSDPAEHESALGRPPTPVPT